MTFRIDTYVKETDDGNRLLLVRTPYRDPTIEQKTVYSSMNETEYIGQVNLQNGAQVGQLQFKIEGATSIADAFAKYQAAQDKAVKEFEKNALEQQRRNMLLSGAVGGAVKSMPNMSRRFQ